MTRPTPAAFLRYLITVPRCAACRQPLGPDEALRGTLGCNVLCPVCRAAWEQEKLLPCAVCGKPQLDCRCMPALLREAGALTLVHLGEYHADRPAGRIILRLKEHRDSAAADFAAAQLAYAVRAAASAHDCAPKTICVTWLPRSRKARRRFGHDQAELLAHLLAARLGAECQPLLERTSERRAQKTQAADARAANIAGAFSPTGCADCRGRIVLLVDDVVTTGASMAEGVRVLRQMGAKTVLGAAIGLTPKH